MSLKRQTLEKTTKFSLGQLRACQHIGLDVDHNDVQAVLDRALGMGNADNRVSGGFYNHVKPAVLQSDLRASPRWRRLAGPRLDQDQRSH